MLKIDSSTAIMEFIVIYKVYEFDWYNSKFK